MKKSSQCHLLMIWRNRVFLLQFLCVFSLTAESAAAHKKSEKKSNNWVYWHLFKRKTKAKSLAKTEERLKVDGFKEATWELLRWMKQKCEASIKTSLISLFHTALEMWLVSFRSCKLIWNLVKWRWPETSSLRDCLYTDRKVIKQSRIISKLSIGISSKAPSSSMLTQMCVERFHIFIARIHSRHVYTLRGQIFSEKKLAL